jgi:predicted NACHT family NTPase
MEDELEQRVLYSIKESVKGLALTTERLVDQLDELETDHKHYEDLCDYLLNGPQNALPEIARSLEHIKALLVAVLVLFVINLFR